MNDKLNEIATRLCDDNCPGLDGSSNRDRAHYICEVMGWDRIDLSERIDFSEIAACKEDDTVEAGRQFLLLQLEFLRRCVAAGLVEKEECDAKVAELSLEVQRVQWHQKHLKKGKPTPPFRFFG